LLLFAPDIIMVGRQDYYCCLRQILLLLVGKVIAVVCNTTIISTVGTVAAQLQHSFNSAPTVIVVMLTIY